jgi:hypothetical protein
LPEAPRLIFLPRSPETCSMNNEKSAVSGSHDNSEPFQIMEGEHRKKGNHT